MSKKKATPSTTVNPLPFDVAVIADVGQFLRRRQETISVAESVTAGLIQAAIASAELASDFFQGGITTYNLGQKSRHLSIDPIQGERCNCVSEDTAVQMALNVAKMFSSDWGVAITGYAAPVPESKERLFAFYAISFRGTLLVKKKLTAKHGVPQAVQVFYLDTVLADLARQLKKEKRR
jgi:nicotinamide-nucleotide amidase